MKNKPYLKMLITVLVSNFVLFLFAFLIVNVLMPSRFGNDAKKTIESELSFIKDESTAEQTYLSSSVQFIFSYDYDTNYQDLYNASYLKNYFDMQKIEKIEILDYIKENELSVGACYSFEGQNGKYVFAIVDKGAKNNADSLFVLYINISPFFRYNTLWNTMLFTLFVFVSIFVLLIGYHLKKNIDQSREMERRFFQNTSHELKTPLMSIQGYAEGIQSGVVEPLKGSRIILEENKRMIKLVKDFLDLSKIDSQHFKSNMIKTDIREIVYETMNMIEASANAKNIKLIPSIYNEPIFVKCDEEQIITSLFNILSNAINYAKSNIQINCYKENNFAIVTIEDDGSGIDKNIIEHIFERFYTTHKGGTGIGLSISKEIIKLHNGEIDAQNTKNGAMFKIKLPVCA